MAKLKADDNLGVIAHVLGLIIGWIGPLIIYFVKDKSFPHSHENARHALNFQISMVIYLLVSLLLIFVFIGFVLVPLLAIFSLIVQIIAIVKSSNGEVYKYPLEIPFVKQ